MKKILTIMVIVSTLFISCKKDNNTIAKNNSSNTTNTGATAQQGKLIYYGYNYNISANNPEIDNLMSVNYDGTGVTKLLTAPSSQFIDNAVMSPDNKTIFLGLFNPINGGLISHGNLCSFNITSATLTTIVDESNTATTTSLDASPFGTIPATATQQSQLLYSIVSNGSLAYNFFELHTANLDGTGDKKIALTLPANSYFYGVSLFPDKKTLLITLGDVTNNNVISLATCNIDGTNFKTLGQITNSQNAFLYPSVVAGTPLLGTIFYYKIIRDISGNYLDDEIWVSNADLSGLKKLNVSLPTSDLYIADISNISLSPDGKTIFFSVSSHNSVSDGIRGIYSCNVDGSNVKVVIPVDPTGVTDYLPLTAY